jgi:HSP20 family protein
MTKKEEHEKAAEEKEIKAPVAVGGKTYLSPFEEMEHWMERFFSSGWPDYDPWSFFRRPWPSLLREGALGMRLPKVDVIDRDEEVVVKAELPGVKKEDLDVTLGDDSLTLRATTKSETKEEKGQYFRREISRGEFSRTIPLPCVVQGDKAKATFKDGVLEIAIPKAAGAKRRVIKID